jgi:hypothetical protein
MEGAESIVPRVNGRTCISLSVSGMAPHSTSAVRNLASVTIPDRSGSKSEKKSATRTRDRKTARLSRSISSSASTRGSVATSISGRPGIGTAGGRGGSAGCGCSSLGSGVVASRWMWSAAGCTRELSTCGVVAPRAMDDTQQRVAACWLSCVASGRPGRGALMAMGARRKKRPHKNTGGGLGPPRWRKRWLTPPISRWPRACAAPPLGRSEDPTRPRLLPAVRRPRSAAATGSARSASPPHDRRATRRARPSLGVRRSRAPTSSGSPRATRASWCTTWVTPSSSSTRRARTRPRQINCR